MIVDWPSLLMEAATRAGAPGLVARGEMLTRMAEADLNRRLRVAGQEASVTLTTDPFKEVALPADFLEARGVYIGYERLEKVSLSLLRTEQLEGYAIQGTTLFSSRAETDHALDYYATLPALGRTLASNWLLAANPDLYLFALLKQMWLAQNNVEAAQAAGAYMATLVAEMQGDDAHRRFGGQMMTFVGATP